MRRALNRSRSRCWRDMAPAPCSCAADTGPPPNAIDQSGWDENISMTEGTIGDAGSAPTAQSRTSPLLTLRSSRRFRTAIRKQQGIHLPPMKRAPTRFGREPFRPAGLFQALEQAMRLLGVELLSKRLTANILNGDLGFTVGLDPSQGAACFPVAIARSDLPKGGARMWPKEITPKSDGSGHELLVDGLGSKAQVIPSRPFVARRTQRDRPCHICERTGQAQHHVSPLTSHCRSFPSSARLVLSTHLRNSSNVAMAPSDRQMVCGVNAPSISSDGNRIRAVNALCNSGSTSAASFVRGR